ncbi:uncharacterized protein BO97DRAFT_277891 [Aspergillus homomorphus CBS 101889]|uniref:Uncharacterized protein n=1 Tax=Aspergillus homomorphus (strain CBS 101889) TaxID=1450537 RepID=A0A395HG91_ASPHC|nr:hypothetical protein BO97DRAFT_277891 [Aspergillus homomorphus CBS 101889]RAL06867.1 hypothetical protein BO97DRAFT_277891 [Aspergillus homomorphus CBS 101889]
MSSPTARAHLSPAPPLFVAGNFSGQSFRLPSSATSRPKLVVYCGVINFMVLLTREGWKARATTGTYFTEHPVGIYTLFSLMSHPTSSNSYPHLRVRIAFLFGAHAVATASYLLYRWVRTTSEELSVISSLTTETYQGFVVDSDRCFVILRNRNDWSYTPSANDALREQLPAACGVLSPVR